MLFQTFKSNFVLLKKPNYSSMKSNTLSKTKQEKLITEIAQALSRNGYMHFLNLETLKIISLNEKINFIEEEMSNIESAPENYLQILPYSDAARQKLRQQFIQKLGDITIKNELLKAIEGYDPMSTFRKTLKKYSDVAKQWQEYKELHFIQETHQWLYENGISDMISPKVQ